MMSRSISTALAAGLVLAALPASADPATQACLGDLDTFLTCPPGSTRQGTECRAKSSHWSGSSRQGPAVFLRDETETDPAHQKVSFAASYKDHKKTGRVFRFDAQGHLESWDDTLADEPHGLSVTCAPDGRVLYTAYYAHGKQVGISRAWNSRTGAFSYAFDHDAQGHGTPVTLSPEDMRRPDELCQPRVCDVHAAPDLSGLPPALR